MQRFSARILLLKILESVTFMILIDSTQNHRDLGITSALLLDNADAAVPFVGILPGGGLTAFT
jgi:hypothetical protein